LGSHTDLLETIATAWAFTGLSPDAALDANASGDLLVEDIDGRIWRSVPRSVPAGLRNPIGGPADGNISGLRG
jgi:hypothetical protein